MARVAARLANKIETLTPLPRNYGVIRETAERTVFVAPYDFVIGDVFRLPEAQLDRHLAQYVAYKKGQYERHRAGRPEYTARVLPFTEETEPVLKKFLDAETETQKSMIVEGLIKMEGAGHLWKKGGKDVVRNGYLGMRIFGADIRSKGDARDAQAKGEWHIGVHLPTGTDVGEYSRSICECPDYAYSDAKNVAENPVVHVCTHVATGLVQLYNDDLGLIHSERSPKPRPILPFNPVDQPFLPQPNGRKKSSYLAHGRRQNLRHVEMDVVVQRALFGETISELNKGLLDIQVLWSPHLLAQLNKSEIYFGAVRQRLEERKEDPAYIGALKELKRRMGGMLHSAGFERTPVYTLGFKGTPDEILMLEYTKGERSVGLAFGSEYPVLIVEKGRREKTATPRLPDRALDLLGREFSALDDKTRSIRETSVRLPEGIRLPEPVRERTRAVLAKRGARGRTLIGLFGLE